MVSATDLILRLIEHEVPHHGLVHLLDLRQEQLEIIELEVAEGAPAAGQRSASWSCRRAAWSCPCCATGRASCPRPTPLIEAGDEVLAVLNPGDEPAVCELFGAYRGNGDGNRPTVALLA